MKAFSESHRRNISLAMRGNKNSFGVKRSEKEREALRNRLLIKNPMNCLDSRKKASSSKTGRKQSLSQRIRTSEIQKCRVAAGKCHLFIDGRTPKNKKIRGSIEYRLWREAIFKRDNWTCVSCGVKGGILNADHIKPFSAFPELRLALENGRTLCKPCHMKTDTWGAKLRFGQELKARA